MAVLTQQQIVQTGLGPTLATAGVSGDKVQPGPTSFLVVRNATGGVITVTVDSKVPSNYGTDVNLAVAVPATTGERWIGPLTAQRFAGVDGLVDVTYSAPNATVASVRV